MIAATVGNGSARMRPKSPWPARMPSRASSARARLRELVDVGADAEDERLAGEDRAPSSRPARARRARPPPTRTRSGRASSACGSPRRCRSSRARPTPTRVQLEHGVVTHARSPRGSRSPCPCRCRAPSGRSGRSRSRRPYASCAIRRTPVAASGCAARDRAAVRIEARIVGGRTPSSSHHVSTCTANGSFSSKRSIVVDREAGLLEHAPRRRHRPVAHQVRLDAGVRVPDEAELRLEAELGDRVLGREERRGRAVGEARRVPGRDAAARAERRLQRARARPATCRAAGTRRASATFQPSSVKTAIGTTVSASRRSPRRRPRAAATGARTRRRAPS